MSNLDAFLSYLASGGVPMAAVLVASALVALMTLRSWRGMARVGPEERAILETRIDSILFWGFFSAVLGLLGTLGGLAQMAQALQADDTASAAVFWSGMRVALSTTVVGATVLVISLPAWHLLRRRWLHLATT